MNVVLLVFFLLASCSASVSPQPQSQPIVARPPIVVDPKKNSEKVVPETGVDQQLDEADKNLDYIRRYIGPAK